MKIGMRRRHDRASTALTTLMPGSLGTTLSPAASASGAGAKAAAARSSSRHRPSHRTRACHIPRGLDNDADNRGGPNDGDGCL
jgi:hypothetical protein